MRALLQKVSQAEVRVHGQLIGRIGPGLLVLLGISQRATCERAAWLADKVVNLRIFPDERDKLNFSLKDIGGELLLVSQFTLWAETINGNRPSFSRAAGVELALPLYEFFREHITGYGVTVEQEKFGAKMQVELINYGPVTILLEAP